MSIRFTIVALFASVFISSLATVVSAEERCTDASLRGSYAFKVDGSNVSGPFAAVGKNTLRRQGRNDSRDPDQLEWRDHPCNVSVRRTTSFV
jgi:hypothetical protein